MSDGFSYSYVYTSLGILFLILSISLGAKSYRKSRRRQLQSVVYSVPSAPNGPSQTTLQPAYPLNVQTAPNQDQSQPYFYPQNMQQPIIYNTQNVQMPMPYPSVNSQQFPPSSQLPYPSVDAANFPQPASQMTDLQHTPTNVDFSKASN